MPFKGNEGKVISFKKAQSYIGGHLKSRQFALSSKSKKIKGGFYGKKILLKILSQPNCVGIRYYHALNAKKQPTIVLVGEDRKGKLLTKLFGNDGPLCPPVCGNFKAIGL